MKPMDLVPTLVKEGAPIIASYLGSPIAGLVVSLIAKHYGLPAEANEQQVQKAMDENPLKLRSLEYEHRQKLAQLLADVIESSERSYPGWWIALVGLSAAIGLAVFIFFEVYKP